MIGVGNAANGSVMSDGPQGAGDYAIDANQARGSADLGSLVAEVRRRQLVCRRGGTDQQRRGGQSRKSRHQTHSRSHTCAVMASSSGEFPLCRFGSALCQRQQQRLTEPHSYSTNGHEGGMSAPRIDSKIVTDSEEFRVRAAHNRALAETLRADVAEAAKGGPEKHRERHISRGKLLPRDRVERLLDPGSPFLEIGQLAACDMYEGEVPGAVIIAGIGRVSGKHGMIVSNDTTVKHS